MKRVEGVAKVTGRARYAAEFELPNLAYGYLCESSVGRGRIASLDVSAAESAPGVLKVISHLNLRDLLPQPENQEKKEGVGFSAFRSPEIFFNGQPIALVVAETFEQARAASLLIRAKYEEDRPETDITKKLETARPTNPDKAPPERGNFGKAFKDAPVKVEAEYHIPVEHHNPIEPHGATAFWKDGKLRVFDKTQNVHQLRDYLAGLFKIPAEDVEITALFVGGAFGSCLAVHYYTPLVVLAAREAGRPVRLSYTRRQMFNGHGYRPDTWQRISLAAGAEGRLTALSHRVVVNTSRYSDYSEDFAVVARLVYACPNVKTLFQNVVTDLQTPAPMRAPGAVSQMFALECAMDELSYALRIDPLELRLINYAEKDPETGKPYSSKALRECYRLGAEKFGWKDRKPEPRSMTRDGMLVGWGVATGVWPALQMKASAAITLHADGTANVRSATTDIGPGTYTVMTIIAAEHLGIEASKVKFELGESKFPKSPAQGGSWTTASVGSAIHGAAEKIKSRLLDLAKKQEGSPLADAGVSQVAMLDGRLHLSSDVSKGVAISELMEANDLKEISETHEATPSPERDKYTCYAHGAQFVEVLVDPDLGTVKVSRVIEVTACGKIMSPTTSHSQEIGGVVWGIGMALQEATEIDHRYGRIMNASLADYHVPVNADVHQIETIFVEEDDRIVNPLGVKGMGELGLVGIPAAIANAVYHATGIRVRDLPITPDKLIYQRS
ncbi:xanthine dehydrogenase family protein molybdopterin-binding subunit [Luteolibacter yonseiensis]|uniref:Xanthine dehydrogenase family protein molybdopterin-binding subunit n=1 Tax=Luteolibacter yonseiensis TaxID=1144680 RepID=A0A934R5Z4_9BACT|nr:xanthine dehydrogenase family protein molybdopterin-binding subunit [Luteolibacter yonseiensis]MBK1817007.1 xanthine dehydrogenase family protein molybdopterin-binding subunit [Luteolibacter yonseiensis]